MTTKSIWIAGVLVAVATARAENKAQKQPAVEPETMAAMQRMGEFLRQQQSFTVGVDTQTDYVLDTGQKVRLSAHGDLRVQRPDRLRAHVISDRKEREFFYDGKTFTMFAPRMGYYATIAAPPTLLDLADLLSDRYGVELPLVDLFRWGTSEADLQQITGATYIGPEQLDGVETDHYAFRQPGLDWQIWIQRGDRPLPRKLVLTTTDDPARPERIVEMSWTLGVKHDASMFAFQPPKDSRRITISERRGSPTAAREK